MAQSNFYTQLTDYLLNAPNKDGQYVISSKMVLEMAKEELTKEISHKLLVFDKCRINPGDGKRYTDKGGKEMTDKTWGGARPGSGRKPSDPKDKRVQMVITIDRETRDKLKAAAKEQHVRPGRLIDEWINDTFYI